VNKHPIMQDAIDKHEMCLIIVKAPFVVVPKWSDRAASE
jgi:hypothetical protein